MNTLVVGNRRRRPIWCSSLEQRVESRGALRRGSDLPPLNTTSCRSSWISLTIIILYCPSPGSLDMSTELLLSRLNDVQPKSDLLELSLRRKDKQTDQINWLGVKQQFLPSYNRKVIFISPKFYWCPADGDFLFFPVMLACRASLSSTSSNRIMIGSSYVGSVRLGAGLVGNRVRMLSCGAVVLGGQKAKRRKQNMRASNPHLPVR